VFGEVGLPTNHVSVHAQGIMNTCTLCVQHIRRTLRTPISRSTTCAEVVPGLLLKCGIILGTPHGSTGAAKLSLLRLVAALTDITFFKLQQLWQDGCPALQISSKRRTPKLRSNRPNASKSPNQRVASHNFNPPPVFRLDGHSFGVAARPTA
jgi:hypothetical protein